MKSIAVLLANGFEEIEALTVVDVLRRAGYSCHTVSLADEMVRGSHDIIVKTDMKLNEKIKNYDLLVLPGGMPGSKNLRDDERVIELVQYFFKTDGKFIAAICAAPIVLERAGIISGIKMTSYPIENYSEIFKASNYSEELVVVDGNVITSRGPSTALEFAFIIIEVLGGDSLKLRQSMLYDMLKENI